MLHLEGSIKQNTSIKAEYRDYDGPTYLYDANKKINPNKHTHDKVAV